MLDRAPYARVWTELQAEKAMLFMAGPRQAGKTTLAKRLAAEHANHLYWNWDIPADRRRLLADPDFFTSLERVDDSIPLVVFDEIHKSRDWKNYLKGAYDGHAEDFHFLVSGSGRLDTYERGGDSLAGRYAAFHLWPLTLAELAGRARPLDAFLEDPLAVPGRLRAADVEAWEALSEFGGFPEPYLAARKTSYRRWSRTYARQLIREDIRDLAGIRSIGDVESLYLLLPTKVGAPLSLPSLAGDLRVSYTAVRSWISVFERFFLGFTIGPWTEQVSRAIRKERKLYLWDTPTIPDEAARFENLIALELWRAVTTWTELGHGEFRLHFVRNKDGQEVDFLIARDAKPFLLVEAKLGQTAPAKTLLKFQRALGVPALQLTNEGKGYRRFDSEAGPAVVAPASLWLSGLP